MRLTVGLVYFYVMNCYLLQLSGYQQFEGGFLLGHISFDSLVTDPVCVRPEGEEGGGV